MNVLGGQTSGPTEIDELLEGDDELELELDEELKLELDEETDPALGDDDELDDETDPALGDDDELDDETDPALKDDDELDDETDPALGDDDELDDESEKALGEDDELEEESEKALGDDDELEEESEKALGDDDELEEESEKALPDELVPLAMAPAPWLWSVGGGWLPRSIDRTPLIKGIGPGDVKGASDIWNGQTFEGDPRRRGSGRRYGDFSLRRCRAAASPRTACTARGPTLVKPAAAGPGWGPWTERGW